MHGLLGGAIALVSFGGLALCLRDLSRWFTSQPAQVSNNKDDSPDYSGVLEALGDGSNGIFEQTCDSTEVVGDASSAICESSFTVASHTLQGLAHILHH